MTTTDGRLTLTVPPGALTVYDLQPAGLQFASHASLSANVPGAVTTGDTCVALDIAFLLAESNGVVEHCRSKGPLSATPHAI